MSSKLCQYLSLHMIVKKTVTRENRNIQHRHDVNFKFKNRTLGKIWHAKWLAIWRARFLGLDLFSRRHYVATHTKYEWKGNWSARHEAPGCRSICLQ
jgi:hypothetical protein